MTLTPSSMINLGFQAPDFSLPDVFSGTEKSIKDLAREKGLLIMFICNHCPYVIHIEDSLLALGNDYHNSKIGIAAINSNDISTYPEDRPELMAKKEFSFPYLFDESQEIAKAFNATCTPDFFLFDKQLQCVYRGQFDDSRPGNSNPVTGRDIRDAISALLNDESINENQKPSIGCNIKWRC